MSFLLRDGDFPYKFLHWQKSLRLSSQQTQAIARGKIADNAWPHFRDYKGWRRQPRRQLPSCGQTPKPEDVMPESQRLIRHLATVQLYRRLLHSFKARCAVSDNVERIAARSRGRSLYDPAYCERVLEVAAEGCGKAEIAAALGVSRGTLSAWAAAHPEFREAMNRAKDLEFAWWLATGRKGQFEKNWNAASWALQMRNRFGKDFAEREPKPQKAKQREAKHAEKLREDMERKLARLADAAVADAVSHEPDAGRAGDPEL
ncbi:MAG TPA: hypothetical protein VE986_02590 [Hyphomicrobiales bacterium]|nr:hypothetical protein [Hyphomicrobiales bacterium]